jgi:DNA-binding transcriptional LysR family regulator
VAVNWIEPRSGRDDEIAFEVNGKTSSTRLKSVVRVSDERAYLTCGINGFGIIQPTRVAAQPFLDKGQLREVLPEICTVPTPLSVTYLKSQTKPERVRVFVEWLVDMFEKKDLADQDMSRVRRLLKDMHPA